MLTFDIPLKALLQNLCKYSELSMVCNFHLGETITNQTRKLFLTIAKALKRNGEDDFLFGCEDHNDLGGGWMFGRGIAWWRHLLWLANMSSDNTAPRYHVLFLPLQLYQDVCIRGGFLSYINEDNTKGDDNSLKSLNVVFSIKPSHRKSNPWVSTDTFILTYLKLICSRQREGWFKFNFPLLFVL